MKNPFRYFVSSPEVIRLTVMMCVWYPLPDDIREALVLVHDGTMPRCRPKSVPLSSAITDKLCLDCLASRFAAIIYARAVT